MNEQTRKFHKLLETYQNFFYSKEVLIPDKFEFIYNGIEKSNSLNTINFYLFEKENNFIHSLKVAYNPSNNTTALFFSFLNPLNKKEKIKNISISLQDLNSKDFLLSILKQNKKQILEEDFPFENFYRSISIHFE